MAGRAARAAFLIMGVTGKSGSRGIAEDLRERVFGAVKDEGVEDGDGIRILLDVHVETTVQGQQTTQCVVFAAPRMSIEGSIRDDYRS